MVGNALLFKRKGEGNASSHCSPAVRSLHSLGFARGTSGGEVLVWLSCGRGVSEDVLLPLGLSEQSAEGNSEV